MVCKVNMHLFKKDLYALIPIRENYIFTREKEITKTKLANVTVTTEISFQNCVKKNITSLFTMKASHMIMWHM